MALPPFMACAMNGAVVIVRELLFLLVLGLLLVGIIVGVLVVVLFILSSLLVREFIL